MKKKKNGTLFEEKISKFFCLLLLNEWRKKINWLIDWSIVVNFYYISFLIFDSIFFFLIDSLIHCFFGLIFLRCFTFSPNCHNEIVIPETKMRIENLKQDREKREKKRLIISFFQNHNDDDYSYGIFFL